MHERFTDDARKAFQLANQEAQRFYHEYIGTEHLLLGLMKLGDHEVNRLLGEVAPAEIIAKVEALMVQGPDMVTMGKLPQTPRVKKAVEFAISESGDGAVTTSHILLSLIKENEGVAAQVLMNLGFSYLLLSVAVNPTPQSPPFESLTLSVPSHGTSETKAMAVLEQVFDALLPVRGKTGIEKSDNICALERVTAWALSKYGVQ